MKHDDLLGIAVLLVFVCLLAPEVPIVALVCILGIAEAVADAVKGLRR